jgi:FMN phosphatase YigB (HAD superfamily)
MNLAFYCDSMRHLVCVPYSVENLHEMARRLGIKRCWFHAGAKYPHYDIPKRRVQEIQAQCTVVSPQDILVIVKGV